LLSKAAKESGVPLSTLIVNALTVDIEAAQRAERQRQQRSYLGRAYCVRIIKESGEAYYIHLHQSVDRAWIPKSQSKLLGEPPESSETYTTLWIADWLAQRRGFLSWATSEARPRE
jgi:hypothetical protein